MMASRGMHVQYLERRMEGPLELGNLPRGQVRELTPEQIAARTEK
jgi:16S rRNA U516 pseudouridylate synthase RsuA-like enzyme